MSFRFNPDYTFEWPVVVQQPVDGKLEEFTFTGVFRMIDEIDLQKQVDFQNVEQFLGAESARIKKVFVGHSGIVDERADQQGELPSNEETIDMLLRSHHVRVGVSEAIRESLFGGAAREKN